MPPVSESAAEPPPPKTQGEEPVAAPPPPTVVVIDNGDRPAEGPKSLAQAASEERERRAQAGKPVAVIDNRNLAEFSKGQKLTVAEGGGATAAEEATAQAVGEAVANAARDEAYWRNRGLEIRRHWRESADRVVELEGKSEELRRRFYAADDPYQRDSQIKPEWDHTLDELDSTRREVERVGAGARALSDRGTPGRCVSGLAAGGFRARAGAQSSRVAGRRADRTGRARGAP